VQATTRTHVGGERGDSPGVVSREVDHEGLQGAIAREVGET